MSIKVSLHHLTHYRFDRPVQIHPHSIRLRPAPHARAAIHSYSLKISPEHFLNWQQDPAGNFLARLVFPERSWELKIQVDMVVELRTINPFDFFLEPEANRYPFPYPADLEDDLSIYLRSDVTEPELLAWVQHIKKDIIRPELSTVDMLVAINQFVARRVSYIIRMEPGIQSCTETIDRGQGSCRDSAFLLMHILRHLGLASRFCSGYLIQLKADETPRKGPAGPEEDFTDLHAWTEVYLPGAGWIGLDATSGLLTGEGHIPLFAAAEPSRAAPVTGSTGICQSDLHFEMKIERIAESPRTTRPYSDSVFQRFQRIVPAVDRKLKELDLRLTMGGEPTFVSDEDLDGPEWNYQAMAPGGDKKKRDFAQRLRKRLVQNLALPAPLFLSGQGKWYPGEPLPRWAYFAHWRLDGEPLSALYSESLERKPATAGQAKELLESLANRLGLDRAFVQPLHEDPLEALRGQANLPEGARRIKDLESFEALERNRLLMLLEKDLAEPSAFVLPLAFDPQKSRWTSSLWKNRRSHLFLLPGDSPAGLRLPLSSLGDGFRSVYMEDPTEQSTRLPDPEHLIARDGNYTLKDDEGRWPLRVALVVEIREETLKIFLPPPSSTVSHLSLIAHLEKCLSESPARYEWEGHPPPAHPALTHFSITPDPGVIEANLQPSESLQEAADLTRKLYEAARAEGLITQKFLMDGRPAATGGGNHITLGARSTLESPFLRFPALLPALLVYWQKHPSLSYLFSGLFIGPTSQAPRVDEARMDTLYDLELALIELYKREDEKCPPYLIDRLLRNHLTDLTGNTHRAEFCIDKMYDPASLGGRRGLLELRGFEMPPHWKMSAVQQALIGAILCFVREKPPEPRLVRWGLDLRDRFMLPHYVREDLQRVLDDLKLEGFDFTMEMFEPFFEFRFPLYGETLYPGIRLELRMALEPWNVLGEEAHTGGTSRAVDSATERMQVILEGDAAGRYQVACNGALVPLRRHQNIQVAGIRFKAWNPASTLHPHIKPHNPLVFSVFDTYNERYVTGCTYHVSHPGGRAYDTLPVNALEAESRRISRFQAGEFGSSHGPAPKPVANPEFPCTLDLRLAIQSDREFSGP
ncbi:MAG: transglutaminase family protein [Leptospiraceae bacterium]|nr:transglutaminase family protein [Leptospiraceae bacterium]MCB1170431.1 transglutaminase family protein [Leptospiraceae bacterium]